MKIKKTQFDITNEKIPISDYKFKQPKSDFLQLPFRLAVIGSTTTGKTTCIVNYLDQGKYRDVFDNITVISPTASVDSVTGIKIEKKFDILKPDAFYPHADFETIRQVVKAQQERINEYSEYLEDVEMYKKFRRDPDSLDDHECQRLYERHKFKKPPKHHYSSWPTQLIIFDDNSDELKQQMISKFVIKSRHLFISLIFITQYYAMIPSLIRNNLSAIILFKTHDKDVLDLLYAKAGFASDMSKDNFYKMLNSLETKYDFLFIDFNRPLELKYKRNFNEHFINFDPK